MPTKIQKQIEERINEKICVSEMNIDIDRLIKELKSLNMRAYDLEAVIYLLNEKETESRIDLIDRLIMFNEFSDKLNIRLVLRPKNLVFSFLKNICTGKKIKIRPTDTDLERKSMAYSPLLPFALFSMSEFINIDTMNIISSDEEID